MRKTVKTYRSLNIRILVLLDIAFTRLSLAFLKYVKLLKNALYFITYSNTFEPGVYIINSRFIIKQGITDNEHFIKTTLTKRPQFRIRKNGCSDKGARNMLGFHPDMHIMIDFEQKVVVKTFLSKVDMHEYESNRRLLTNFISAPKFKVRDKNTYQEELVPGREFLLTSSNKAKFNSLLKQYLRMTETIEQTFPHRATQNCDLSLLENYFKPQHDIDFGMLMLLLTTPIMALSKGSDIAGPNIIEDTNRLFLIDWEPKELKIRPFWTDPINLLIKCDPKGFVDNKYQEYLLKLLQRCLSAQAIVENDKLIRTVLAASFLMNLPKIHQFDLVENGTTISEKHIQKVTKLDLEKVSRNIERFYRNTNND